MSEYSSEDLVDKLRAGCYSSMESCDSCDCFRCVAADRIEQLEAALENAGREKVRVSGDSVTRGVRESPRVFRSSDPVMFIAEINRLPGDSKEHGRLGSFVHYPYRRGFVVQVEGETIMRISYDAVGEMYLMMGSG